MARFGTPVWKPSQECCVFVTIETPSKDPQIKLWVGTSFKAIRDRVKEVYKGSKVQFGNCFWRTK
jgi:hypothetical protein